TSDGPRGRFRAPSPRIGTSPPNDDRRTEPAPTRSLVGAGSVRRSSHLRAGRLDLELGRDDGARRGDHRRGPSAVRAALAVLAAVVLAARLVVQPGLEEAGLLDLARGRGFARGDHALRRREHDGRILLVLLERADLVLLALGAARRVAAARDVA